LALDLVDARGGGAALFVQARLSFGAVHPGSIRASARSYPRRGRRERAVPFGLRSAVPPPVGRLLPIGLRRVDRGIQCDEARASGRGGPVIGLLSVARSWIRQGR
jgi:hypothetical protein